MQERPEPSTTSNRFVEGVLVRRYGRVVLMWDGKEVPVEIEGDAPLSVREHFVLIRGAGPDRVRFDQAASAKARAQRRTGAKPSATALAKRKKAAKKAAEKAAAEDGLATTSAPRKFTLSKNTSGDDRPPPRSKSVRTVSGGAPSLGKRR
jgi:hypothetical protein